MNIIFLYFIILLASVMLFLTMFTAFSLYCIVNCKRDRELCYEEDLKTMNEIYGNNN